MKVLKSRSRRQSKKVDNGLGMIPVYLRKSFEYKAMGRLIGAQCELYRGLTAFEIATKTEKSPKRCDALYSSMDNFRSLIRKIDDKIQNYLSTAQPCLEFTRKIDYREVGYTHLFRKYFNSKVVELLIEEPQIDSSSDFQTLISLLSVILEACTNLKTISISTNQSFLSQAYPLRVFQNMRKEFQKRNVDVFLVLEENHKYRQIFLSTGIILKLERSKVPSNKNLLIENITILKTTLN